MTRLERLEEQAASLGIIVDYAILRESDGLDGLYIAWESSSVILINAHRPYMTQVIALAEEIGHHLKSRGNIVRLDTVTNRKSEEAGRAWSYRELMPPEKVHKAIRSGICSVWELAEAFNVSDGFVKDAIAYYRRKNALPTLCGWCRVV